MSATSYEWAGEKGTERRLGAGRTRDRSWAILYNSSTFTCIRKFSH